MAITQLKDSITQYDSAEQTARRTERTSAWIILLLHEDDFGVPLAEQCSFQYTKKLVEQLGLIDSTRLMCVGMKDKFLFEVFTAFCVSLV